MPQHSVRNSKREFLVTLAGYFGFGNLGDELLASSSIEILNDCGIQKDKIAILSADPKSAEKSLGVKAFDRWSLSGARKALSKSESMLFAGGGLFQDSTSFRSVFYYWGLSSIATIFSCKTWAMAQSVGPLESSISRFLTKNAFSRCEYVAARDDRSLQMLLGLNLNASLMPDLVLGLKLRQADISQDGPVVVNVRPTLNGTGGRLIANMARRLRENDTRLVGVALSPDDAAEFAQLSKSDFMPEMDVHYIKSAEDFFKITNGCRAAIGMRLHFGILCSLSGIDPLLYPYDPKVSAFAEEYGLQILLDEFNDENFDIMNLLTNRAFRVKKRIDAPRDRIKNEFERAIEIIWRGRS